MNIDLDLLVSKLPQDLKDDVYYKKHYTGWAHEIVETLEEMYSLETIIGEKIKAEKEAEDSQRRNK